MDELAFYLVFFNAMCSLLFTVGVNRFGKPDPLAIAITYVTSAILLFFIELWLFAVYFEATTGIDF